jgi:hypothetical protein
MEVEMLATMIMGNAEDGRRRIIGLGTTNR